MLALSFTFPAGRYHATPWDRHVNEGAVAWPPEPWRILRALIATWHHKVKHTQRFSESTLLGLIESLAQELPDYTLPAASHSHTRHYMPQFAAGKISLVFDAFTAVDRKEPLTVTWPTVDLPDEQMALLDELLSVMGYLGRAESWVEARRLNQAPEASETMRCVPGADALDTETGELKAEAVTLFAPLPNSEYQALRERFLADKRAAKKLGRTLPENLLDALSVDTAALRKQGWSQPPAARKASYVRPVHALRPVRVVHKATPPPAITAQFILIGKPLPRVEDSLRIGELMRLAVMGQAKRLFGEDHIPAVFSGHGMPDDNRHGHAFYLPWDSDGDGRLDRVLVHVPSGMDAQQRHMVEKLNRIWSRDGGKWCLVLESIGRDNVSTLLSRSTHWTSVTPYLHPWHRKKTFDVEDQIHRECRERGLPEPVTVERFGEALVGHQKRRPIHFHRFRNRRGLTQPDRLGGFWRLSFPEPVGGPLALGFACHFGLGLFVPCLVAKRRGE
jgi:CRISPR-associated protein Csb2